MPAPVTTTAEVIADRYLTSPVSLRSRPFGPVDALDTHAGRAAQVRIVFLSSQWSDAQLAETVARWCGIGTAGVIGVLDFGEHNGHPFLVLPPSLGMPLERWRSMRRPSAVDAARLTLGFGRLVEAITAAGFTTDVAEPCDFGVGPGPTPFLEVPLLGRPDAPAPLHRGREGQAVIATLYGATVWDTELPAELAEWRSRTTAGQYSSLAQCLDALEAAASAVRDSTEMGEPLGVRAVFDRPLGSADTPSWWSRRHPFWARRWWKGLSAALAVFVILTQAAHLIGGGEEHQIAAKRPVATKPQPPAATTPATPKPVAHPAKPRTRKPTGPKRKHPRVVRHRRHKVAVTPAPPPSTPTPPPSTPTPTPPPSTTRRSDGPIGVRVGGGDGGSGVVELRHPSSPS